MALYAAAFMIVNQVCLQQKPVVCISVCQMQRRWRHVLCQELAAANDLSPSDWNVYPDSAFWSILKLNTLCIYVIIYQRWNDGRYQLMHGSFVIIVSVFDPWKMYFW